MSILWTRPVPAGRVSHGIFQQLAMAGLAERLTVVILDALRRTFGRSCR